MGYTVGFTGKKEDKAFIKLHLRGVLLEFVLLPVLLKTSIPGKFEDVILHPVGEDIIIEFLHLGIGNVEGVACPLCDRPEFWPQGQGKKLRIEWHPLELAGGGARKQRGVIKFKGSHPLLISPAMMDYRIAVLKDIPIGLGFVKDGDTLLVKKTVIQVKTGYQPGTFNTHLRHSPEVDVLKMGYPFGEIIVLQ